MHRELKLVENGIIIATYYSDHNDHDNTLNQDMEKFMFKIKAKQAGNFNWTFELKKAFKNSFPKIITKPVLRENESNEFERKICNQNKMRSVEMIRSD